jgi:hypothetical protein
VSLPAALASVPIVQRTYVYRDGTVVAGGIIRITLATTVDVGLTSVIPKVITITLDETGTIPADLTLASTNDPDASITGLAYTVHEQWTGGRRGLLTVAYDAASVDLADMVEFAPSPAYAATVAAAESAAAAAASAAEAAASAEEAGSASVTNASVNTAIESDPAATRTSLGLGTAATTAATAYATSTQGDKADTALQPAAVGVSIAELVGGVVPTAQIPAIAISEYLGEVADQAAMLALTGEKGDWAIRTDLGTTWVITGDDPTQLADWTALSYPGAPVTSINGQAGVVVLSASDVGAEPTQTAASQAEAEAGTGTTVRSWTPQRIWQAIAASLALGTWISGATGKATPVDADTLPLSDSAASNGLKKLTWANLKATLKTYLDTLYADKAVAIGIACSDETTALTTGTAKATFRMPYAMTLTAVRASVNTAPTGSVLTVDINEAGTTILSTKLTIDASEKTSTTAATPAVISDSALADDAEITIDIDGVGSTIAGKGLKVWLIGTR